MKKKSFDWSAFVATSLFDCLREGNLGSSCPRIAAGVSSVYMTYQIGRRRSADRCRSSAVQRPLSHFAFVCRSGFSDCGQSMVDPTTRQPRGVFIRRRFAQGFAHLNTLPLRYYDQNSHGNIVSRFTNDMDNISIAVAAVFNQLFSGISVVLIALVVMLQMSVPLNVGRIGFDPDHLFGQLDRGTNVSSHFARQQEIVGEISGFVTEMIGNQKSSKPLIEKPSTKTVLKRSTKN